MGALAKAIIKGIKEANKTKKRSRKKSLKSNPIDEYDGAGCGCLKFILIFVFLAMLIK
jgi:hypothetical protein